MGSAIGVDLFKGVQQFKKRINPQAVYDAWIQGDYSKLMEVIPWEHFGHDLDRADAPRLKASSEAWGITLESMPVPKDPFLRWDTKNPHVRELIAGRKAANFKDLTEDSAENIQGWVTRSMNQALSPRDVADGIKSSIGLLPQHAKAVERYRGTLTAQGQPKGKVDQLSSAYADRLLDYRAMTIGRTETRILVNQSQLSVWRQAGDTGLIDRHRTGKTWVVDGNPCELCLPMDGVTVALDGFWTLPDGTPVDCPPLDVHPNCECGMQIDYDYQPDDSDQDDDSDDDAEEDNV
jgi:hypothetical protein